MPTQTARRIGPHHAIPHAARLAPLVLLALLALPWAAHAAAHTEDAPAELNATPASATSIAAERSLSPAPVRHLLVKAMGQGFTPQEAEAQAVQNARALAARHLAALGGAQALATGEDALRLVSMKHFPAMGFGQPRALVFVELRLRGLAQPSSRAADPVLLVLRASVAAGQLSLEANRPCEAVAAYLPAPKAEPEMLPGGVQSFRLSPGKTLRHPLPSGLKSLDVLACSGGLNVPADPASLDEAFTKARAGRPQLSQREGVVSDCVHQRLDLRP